MKILRHARKKNLQDPNPEYNVFIFLEEMKK